MSDSTTVSNKPCLRHDDPATQSIIKRLMGKASSETNANGRAHERFSYIRTVQIELVHSNGFRDELRAPAINISRQGLAFLHPGFLHIGTKCLVQLVTLHNSWIPVEGQVAYCAYVEQGIHQVGIRFSKPLDMTAFSREAIHRRVLLVDDDPLAVNLSQYYLKRMNCEIKTAENGQKALDILAKESFDIILLDLEMPVMDGRELVKKLRDRAYSGCVIALTGINSEDDRERCLREGFNRYVSKPVTHELLMDLLSSQDEEPLFSSLSSDERMIEIINKFVEGLPNLIHNIEQALIKPDIVELGKLVRALKGIAGGYGFQPISDAACNIESALTAEPDHEQLKSLVRALGHLCRLARVTEV